MLDSRQLLEKGHLFGNELGGSSKEKASASVGFVAGYEACQREYEDKLRWIPIEEKLPEPNSDVLAKGINGRIEVIHFKEIQFSTVHHLRYVTHWRSFL